MAACNCTVAMAICAIIRSSACCAMCGCTRSSKAPTKSCGSSSAAIFWKTDLQDTPLNQDILFERRGAAGVVTLNRPKALNAITHEMVHALSTQLDLWTYDDAVTRVIVTANGDRAFCAGGDIRALYELGKAGKQEQALRFFREEYVLNAKIKRYRKPYISLIDGIVMGGGVGISIHGS